MPPPSTLLRSRVILAWILAMAGGLRAEVTIDAPSVAATTTRPTITGTTSDATELTISITDASKQVVGTFSSHPSTWMGIVVDSGRWSCALGAYGRAGLPQGTYGLEIRDPARHLLASGTLRIDDGGADAARLVDNRRVGAALTPVMRLVVDAECPQGQLSSVQAIGTAAEPVLRIQEANDDEDLTLELTPSGRIRSRADAWKPRADALPVTLDQAPAAAREKIAELLARTAGGPLATTLSRLDRLGTPQQPYYRALFSHPTRVQGERESFLEVPRMA